jgi:predicted nucleic acid-binding protein
MSAGRLALDTNVLVYFVDSADRERCARAQDVVRRAAQGGQCVLAFQSIGEFYTAVTRRRVQPPAEAAEQARDWMALFPLVEAIAADARGGLDAAAARRFSYWDALLLTTLGRVGCTALLSEDMQDGAGLTGVTVLNPFVGGALPERIATLLG